MVVSLGRGEFNGILFFLQCALLALLLLFLYASASAGTLLHRPTLANGVITSTNPDVGVQDNLYAGIAMPHLSIS